MWWHTDAIGAKTVTKGKCRPHGCQIWCYIGARMVTNWWHTVACTYDDTCSRPRRKSWHNAAVFTFKILSLFPLVQPGHSYLGDASKFMPSSSLIRGRWLLGLTVHFLDFLVLSLVLSLLSQQILYAIIPSHRRAVASTLNLVWYKYRGLPRYRTCAHRHEVHRTLTSCGIVRLQN